MSTDWNIQAPACTCTACQKTFADGDQRFSLLQFGAEGYAEWSTLAAAGISSHLEDHP